MVNIDLIPDKFNITMQPATITNKALLITYLESVIYQTRFPDFIIGLESVDEIIFANTSGLCNGIIVLLTAGMSGPDLDSHISSFTSSLNTSYRLHSVALGGCETNQLYSFNLSCDNNGFYFASAQNANLFPLTFQNHKLNMKSTTKRIIKQ